MSHFWHDWWILVHRTRPLHFTNNRHSSIKHKTQILSTGTWTTEGRVSSRVSRLLSALLLKLSAVLDADVAVSPSAADIPAKPRALEEHMLLHTNCPLMPWNNISLVPLPIRMQPYNSNSHNWTQFYSQHTTFAEQPCSRQSCSRKGGQESILWFCFPVAKHQLVHLWPWGLPTLFSNISFNIYTINSYNYISNNSQPKEVIKFINLHLVCVHCLCFLVKHI